MWWWMLAGWRQSGSGQIKPECGPSGCRHALAVIACLSLAGAALASPEAEDAAGSRFARQIIVAQECAWVGERAARLAEKAAQRIGDAIRAERRAVWLARTAAALRGQGGREYLAARRGADLARSERDSIVREARAVVKQVVAELDALLDLPEVLRTPVRTVGSQSLPFSQQLVDQAAQLRSAATPVREAVSEVQAVYTRAELFGSRLTDEQGRRMEESFVRRRANLVEVLAPLVLASERLAQTSREAARWLDEAQAKQPRAPLAQAAGGWGVGVGIGFLLDVGGRDRVDSAHLGSGDGSSPSIVRVERDDSSTPHVVLEAHYLLPAASLLCRADNCNTSAYDEASPHGYAPKVLRGMHLGPFVAIQPGDDFVDAVGAGLLLGIEMNAVRDGDRLQVGVGYFADPNTRVLADGFRANQPPPQGETQVRFQSVTQTGVMVLLTYGF